MSNDTQHYTNLEIFHALIPKLDAISPIDFVALEKDYEAYSPIIDAIATAYRSGYGRGQKGRSFLIGEKKNEGELVCWIGKSDGYYQPKTVGTIGRIDQIDMDGDIWVFWPAGSCGVHYNTENKKSSWCCHKRDCLRIDTKVKGDIKKGDKIVYLGTGHGFLCDGVWPDRVATGVVDNLECVGGGCVVRWDNPDVVNDHYNGRTHIWFEDIAKVIPWD